jgi:hypothetical protein
MFVHKNTHHEHEQPWQPTLLASEMGELTAPTYAPPTVINNGVNLPKDQLSVYFMSMKPTAQ